MKVGFGYDVHAFAEGRPLKLGGVEIPFERGLGGHSDGDVLSHSIADAILGAAALGDIGQHFPSSDERWRDASSLELVRQVVQMLSAVWLRVTHVDATVVCEDPAIGPHRDAMRTAISGVIGIKAEEVSVKATTTDGIGSIGRGEGIAAFSVIVLEDAAT